MRKIFLIEECRLLKKFIYAVLALLVFALPQLAAAQGDGPRTFMLVPSDTKALSQFYFQLNGNQTADPSLVIPNGNVKVDLLATMYNQTFEFNGKQGAIFGILPYGKVSGSLSAFGRSISGSDQGMGDLILGGILGLINSPNLALQDYATRPVTPNLGILAKLTLPTGSYSSGRILNMGANRWALQVGFPMAAYIGKSMVDPRLTSFELTPSATIFSDNTDPSGGASYTSQEVIYQLEAHVTHNLNRTLWVSLDALKTFGGATSTNGVGNNNKQNSLAVGVTVNYSFTPSTFLKVTYGETVSSNSTGADGNLLRFQFGYVF